MKTLTKGAIAVWAALAVATPTSTIADTVRHDPHGTGTQRIAKDYNNGSQMTGRARSLTGANIYFNGQGDWTAGPAIQCSGYSSPKRYTGLTNSRTNITMEGFVGWGWPSPFCGPSKVRVRMCKANRLAPDNCHTWSRWV